TEEDEEASGPELAEALTFQLRRLDSMREAGEKLLVLPRLGRDVFRRGAPEGMEVVRTAVYEVSLYDLLKAYGDNRRRATGSHLTIEASQLYSLSDAIERLRGVMGEVGDWTSLSAFLPEDLRDGLFMRSAVASTFAASLEMVKEGRANIRQSSAFGPIFIKGKEAAANG
ncbi:MAG: segregation/condensation protein A, partial [Rhodospirillaceae bacterium]|nr:segregation/condensation protein A [Rhodospirillaceae bacterium]